MKILTLLLVVVTIVLISFSLNKTTTSQNVLSNFYEDKNYNEGEMIVMFKSGTDVQSFMNNYSNIDLSIKEILVKDMNIYLLQYNVTRSAPVDALISVMRNNSVAIAPSRPSSSLSMISVRSKRALIAMPFQKLSRPIFADT